MGVEGCLVLDLCKTMKNQLVLFALAALIASLTPDVIWRKLVQITTHPRQ